MKNLKGTERNCVRSWIHIVRDLLVHIHNDLSVQTGTVYIKRILPINICLRILWTSWLVRVLKLCVCMRACMYIHVRTYVYTHICAYVHMYVMNTIIPHTQQTCMYLCQHYWHTTHRMHNCVNITDIYMVGKYVSLTQSWHVCIVNIQTFYFSEGEMDHDRPGVPEGPGGPLSPANIHGANINHMNPSKTLPFIYHVQ